MVPFYHITRKTGMVQPQVQWHQLRPIPDDYLDPFDSRTSYHNFADFGIMNGNAEAYNAEHAFKLAKGLRNTKIVMGVFKPASSTGDYYRGQLCIPNIEDRSQLFKEHDQLVVCDKPRPEVAEAEKIPKDTVPGWRAVVLSENFVMEQADVAILLERPKNPDHPSHSKKIRAATSLNDPLPIHHVYLRLFLNANTIKARLNALEKHRYTHRPEPAFENKRRILIGRDLSVTSTRDWLRDLPNDRIEEIAQGMDEAQKQCFRDGGLVKDPSFYFNSLPKSFTFLCVIFRYSLLSLRYKFRDFLTIFPKYFFDSNNSSHLIAKFFQKMTSFVLL